MFSGSLLSTPSRRKLLNSSRPWVGGSQAGLRGSRQLKGRKAAPITGHRESTTVQVRVSPLQTETSDLDQSLDRSTIEGLPFNERDFLRLALLTPGIVPPVQGSQLSARGGFAKNVNGGPQTAKTAAAVERLRRAVLDLALPLLVWLEGCDPHFYANRFKTGRRFRLRISR